MRANFANNFSELVIQIAIQAIKTGRAVGIHRVYPEFLRS